jgi:cell division protein FtsL/ElaB/YqjD/DUF883 family membrane-anchored ribosome-binding protein
VRKKPLKQDQAGDFSIAFGDMVFGLLFFFFVLSLAIIFNKPDMKQVHHEADKRLREIARQQQEITQLKQQLTELQQENAKARYERLIRDLKTKLSEQVYNYRKVKIQLRNQRRKYKKTVTEIEDLKEEIDNLYQQKSSTSSYTLKRLRSQIEQDKKSIKKLRKNMGRMAKDINSQKHILSETKQLLKDNDLLDILADVEAVESGVVVDENSGKGENAEENDDEGLEIDKEDIYKLYVKLFAKDNFGVKVFKGNREVSVQDGMSLDDLVEAADIVKNQYKDDVAAYPEEEQKKNMPCMFLMTNPDVMYGTVQEALKKLQKVIPIRIRTWKEK